MSQNLTIQTNLTGVALQHHQIKSSGFCDVLDYSYNVTNFLLRARLRGYAKAYQQARDQRFAEGVTLGALQQARYMTYRHSKQIIKNPGWYPQVYNKFILLPKNHYSILSIKNNWYLCAPLGASRSGIAPLAVQLDYTVQQKVARKITGDALITHNLIYITYRERKSRGL